MVECTALEMRHTCKGIVGSNPTLSAIGFLGLLTFRDYREIAVTGGQNRMHSKAAREPLPNQNIALCLR